MGDSNFSIGEMRLISTAFVALVIFNGMLFGTGILDTRMTTEPPRLNVTGQDIVRAGELPLNPGSPNEGLVCSDCNQYQQTVFLDDEHTVTVIDAPDTGPTDAYEVNYFNNTAGTELAEVFLNEDNPNASLGPAEDYEIYVELENNATGTVRWRLIDAPEEDSGWFDRIPIVGGVTNIADAIAGVVAWIAAVVQWFVALVVEIVLSVIVTVIQILTFFVDLATYVIDGWITVTTAVSDINTYFVLLLWGPQIPLYLILFNGLMKVLKVLPTT